MVTIHMLIFSGFRSIRAGFTFHGRNLSSNSLRYVAYALNGQIHG